MDKKLFVHLQGGRKVSGTLRGYDLFLNLVIDEALEETTPGQKHPIGTVVRDTQLSRRGTRANAYARLSAGTASRLWRPLRRYDSWRDTLKLNFQSVDGGWLRSVRCGAWLYFCR